jgi:choline dehydrogenase-like flavoprotein
VLSYELSKRSNYSILVIEAGGIFNGLSSAVPIMSTLMQGSKMDWSLKSVPQKYSSRGLSDARQSIPRGKGLGGSSQLNYLLHFNGVKKDFDEWERLGADGWNYSNLQYFLNRHETDAIECPSGGNECQSDDDMPKLSITSIMRGDSKLVDAFLSAENQMQRTFHPNITIKPAKFTTKRGLRHNVFHEYLRRAYKHKNLSIMVHAKVEKIEFNEKK